MVAGEVLNEGGRFTRIDRDARSPSAARPATATCAPRKVRQLYLELQSDFATPAPRQRNKDTGVEPALFRRLQLTANELQCLLPG
jgi:hypothetical protein